MTGPISPRPLFHTVTMNVLERAKDAGDEMVVAACRRLIWAFTLGFKRHALAADIALVRAFSELA